MRREKNVYHKNNISENQHFKILKTLYIEGSVHKIVANGKAILEGK